MLGWLVASSSPLVDLMACGGAGLETTTCPASDIDIPFIFEMGIQMNDMGMGEGGEQELFGGGWFVGFAYSKIDVMLSLFLFC